MSPSWISTIGDPEKHSFVVDRGVAQGSPLSPTRYNLFIDDFPERVSTIPAHMSDVPEVLFADDVLLSERSPEGL